MNNPTVTQAMIDELIRVGLHYHSGGGIGPTIPQWDRVEAIGMSGPKLISTCYGTSRHKESRAHWNKILAAAGLRPATRSEAIQSSKRAWRREADEDWTEPHTPKTGSGMYQPVVGMRAVERQRVIRQWDPETHAWQEAARQVVYELC